MPNVPPLPRRDQPKSRLPPPLPAANNNAKQHERSSGEPPRKPSNGILILCSFALLVLLVCAFTFLYNAVSALDQRRTASHERPPTAPVTNVPLTRPQEPHLLANETRAAKKEESEFGNGSPPHEASTSEPADPESAPVVFDDGQPTKSTNTDGDPVNGEDESEKIPAVGSDVANTPDPVNEPTSTAQNPDPASKTPTAPSQPIRVLSSGLSKNTVDSEVNQEAPTSTSNDFLPRGDQPMFDGRSGAIKDALLARFGGTQKTQEAVKRGLEWLQRNQTRKGSWSMRGPFSVGGSTENKTAATAMALLAYLGDGHTHKKGDYQEQVERGIKWLISQQNRQGFFAKNASIQENMYAQAQATITICELYGMTGDSSLRPHAQRAIDFAEKSQSEAGGWRYEPNKDSDTSMTGWYVMALESGRSAKLDVNVKILNRVMLYLDDAASYDGAAYGYQAQRPPSSAMTAEGLLCRQYIGWKRDHPPMVRGISALVEDAPFDMADQDVYYWYYATQVLHHYGGSPWRRWNDVMKVELPKMQVKTGRESGSWDPQRDRWGKNFGRLYTTCLSIYCLEVYYRHMPLYNTAAAPKPASK